jgi:Transposase DDE domain
LLPAVMNEVEKLHAVRPQELLVDGGYVSAENIAGMQARQVELIGPVADMEGMVSKQSQQRGIYTKEAFQYDAASDTYRCPAGQILVHITTRQEPSRIEHEYRAKQKDCAACPNKQQCCPKARACGRTVVRSEPQPIVREFRAKMQSDAYKKLYRTRSEVAEFPNAWLKTKLGLSRFRLRGLVKAGIESLWAVITYNVRRAIRLIPRPPQAAAVGC